MCPQELSVFLSSWVFSRPVRQKTKRYQERYKGSVSRKKMSTEFFLKSSLNPTLQLDAAKTEEKHNYADCSVLHSSLPVSSGPCLAIMLYFSHVFPFFSYYFTSSPLPSRQYVILPQPHLISEDLASYL